MLSLRTAYYLETVFMETVFLCVLVLVLWRLDVLVFVLHKTD